MEKKIYHFFPTDQKGVIARLGPKRLKECLRQMFLIRHFEIRGEAAYQQGKVGGFYHSYMGQEAIQTACVAVAGKDHWFTTTYRCHALALLLQDSPETMMAELYGKTTGIAKGRGGSMHMYSDRLLGGLAIVGGHVPIATGAAFTIRYLKEKGKASFCFLGEGAVVQGAVHESLNMASLWNLPGIYVIENNQWGMGTSVERAVAVKPIAENYAKAYGISSYTMDGLDFFNCCSTFEAALKECVTHSRPVLMEAVTERFKGHSISDPGLYRTKDALKEIETKDPLILMKKTLIAEGIITEEEVSAMDLEEKERVLKAMEFAEQSPLPDVSELELGVFAPEEEPHASC